ncbi:hypothetical protein GE300_06410 [Rhodobacteraceae bacterium 2CG4]|uniref:Collagenase NC10/endostatin n=2 Tax=Halovulum marinum TaxID=2662447 RepID=A0A6L5YZF8_9RHOB|nr:hypothetical protein [Halovulum marinum]
MKKSALALVALIVAAPVFAQDAAMSFFITSENPGNGADLGGLDGADAYCGELAAAAGVSGKTWRAYLSTSEVDARDRIGSGPWVNANGDEIASDLEALHGENNISKDTALDETGNVVNGRGDDPNRHDILTGSNSDGTFAGQSCEDWTASGEGSAVVGHHDRMGLDESPPMLSWNSSHPSRGCSLEALRSTGGDGLLYCFAAE